MRTTCSTRLNLTSRPQRPLLTMSPRAPQHEQRPPWWVSVVQHLEPHPSLFQLGWVRVRAYWYARRDSNPHARRHQDLNLGRLPIPPLALCRAYSTDFCADGRTRRPLGRALVDRAWAQEDPRERPRRCAQSTPSVVSSRLTCPVARTLYWASATVPSGATTTVERMTPV